MTDDNEDRPDKLDEVALEGAIAYALLGTKRTTAEFVDEAIQHTT